MANCPSENSLLDLVRGGLTPARAAAVRAHLDDCSLCYSLIADFGHARASTGSDARSSAPPAPETLPTQASQVGRYQLKRLLGAGAMGVVYEAYDPKLNRVVAVKLLRPKLEPDAAETGLALRMLREAQAMAKLNHPNVVSIYDVGEQGDAIFIAMELVGAGTLATWLAEAPRTPKQVLAMYLAAGRGLAAAHEAGLVHRDFKPDNVLVGVGGEVRVTDFGLARRSEQEPDGSATTDTTDLASVRLTHTGAFVGTPAYMSPEQMRREPATQRSDIFSFCAALYEALHGVRPFEGNTLATLRANISEGRLSEARGGARVPSAVRRVLRRGLDPLPERRFDSMGELLGELELTVQRRWQRPVLLGAFVAGVVGVGLGAAGARSARRGTATDAPRLESFSGAPAPVAPKFWELSRDFSTAHNPNGPWSYGWMPALGGPFACAQPGMRAGLQCWMGNMDAKDTYASGNPSLLHNATSAPLLLLGSVAFAPGESVVHPGPHGELAVVRWTAPEPDWYEIRADFYTKDHGDVGVHVLHGGASVYDADVGVGQSSSYGDALCLAACDTMDFAVGFGSAATYRYGSTGLSVNVRRTEAPANARPCPMTAPDRDGLARGGDCASPCSKSQAR